MPSNVTNAALSQFRPVQMEFGKIHMKGGHVAKSLPMTSKTVEGPNRQNVTFIKLATSEAWLIAAVTGSSKSSSSSFGRTSLLQELRDQISKMCDGEEVAPSSVVAAVPQGDDYDPMEEVELTDAPAQRSPSKAYGQGNKRTRYYKNLVVGKIVPLDMPVRCPEEDPQCTELRTIRVYVENRIQLWLDLADVEWAVRYLYVQNLLKGVPLIPDESTGPGWPCT